jgi:tetratricopeptide (TPR) repeat protein
MHAKSTKTDINFIKEDLPKNNHRIKFWTFSLVIIILTFGLYQTSFTHDFVNWDDQVYVEEQPLVLQKQYAQLWKSPVSLNYHPITMMSLAVQTPTDAKKVKAAPFIKLNVAIHIVNSVLVFSFILLITGYQWWVAFFTVLVFAIHPMHVESVVWVSERKDVLYTFFFLLSCISYVYYLKDKALKWLACTGIFFLASVLSKAMAVTIPLVWILLDFWNGRKLTEKMMWLEKMPFLAISMFFGMMAISVQSGSDFGGILTLTGAKVNALAAPDTFTLWERFQFASYGFVQYLYKFFYPMEIGAFYPYPEGNKLNGFESVLYPLLSLVIVGIGIYLYKKSKAFSFGIGYYLITVALVLQFLSVGTAILADRYTYVPYIGVAFVMFYLGQEMLQKKSKNGLYLFIGLSSLFSIFLALKTSTQVKVWKNSETLWSQVLQYYPKEDLALANRGNHRGKTGNIEGAIADFEKAIADGCLRADVYEGLGNSYGTLSNQKPDQKEALLAKAIAMYQKALELEPQKGNIHFNLGISQLQTNPVQSVHAFTEALRLMPYKEMEILPVLGLSLLNAGKYQDAIQTITQAIEKGVETEFVYYYRGLAYYGMGDTPNAVADFNKALSINPKNQEIIAKKAALGL